VDHDCLLPLDVPSPPSTIGWDDIIGYVYEAGDRKGGDLHVWLADEFHRRFRFLQQPPEWIQGPPHWPMVDNRPMVFLGQFDVNGYFHDAASVYVFHDGETGRYETMDQVY